MTRERTMVTPTWTELLGIKLEPDRLEEDLRAYADILEALRSLRELDLTDVHPAVVFDPTAPYGEGELP
jgi:putative NADH-flavin reductase